MVNKHDLIHGHYFVQSFTTAVANVHKIYGINTFDSEPSSERMHLEQHIKKDQPCCP